MGGGLDEMVDDFLREYVDENPVAATKLGIDGHDDRLADLSEAGFRRRGAWTASWIETLESATELTDDERIDRDVLCSTLRCRQILHDWGDWRRNPALYVNQGLHGVFELFLHRTRPDAELARDATARLRSIPETLEHARRNVDADLAPPVFVERATDTSHAAIAYCRDAVPAEVDGDVRSELAEAGEAAASAYAAFAQYLDDLRGRARGEFAIGEQRYSAMLQTSELLGYGARELRERGRREYETISEEMSRRARDLIDTEDWLKAIETISSDRPGTPEEMRASYQEWTERARAFLMERGLCTLPDGEQCLVEPSPPFQRPVMAVASYSSPPPFKRSLTGHFFVPYPPDGEPPDRLAKRMEANNFAAIPGVSVHEAYPGHHWHMIMMASNARTVRKAFGSSYFSEGWALYTEKMMLDEGFYGDPRRELATFGARIFRAARIIVDTSLHIGDMDVEQAVDFMMTKTGIPEPTARAEVGRYCTWPTQASSYLTGCLEIERMRERWFAEGRGDLRAFHDRITSSGSLPLALAERALFGSSN